MGSYYSLAYSTVGDFYTALSPGELMLIEYVTSLWLVYYALNYAYTAWRVCDVTSKAKNRRALRDKKIFRIPEISAEKTAKILAAKGVFELVKMQID